MTTKRFGMLFLGFALSAAVAMAPSAKADTKYTYQGNNYDTCGGTYCTGGPYALSVTFNTTLAGDALKNLPYTDITSTITSFVFTDGSGLTIDRYAGFYYTFQISTDASGNIITWMVGACDNNCNVQMQTNWNSPYGFIPGADFSETTPSFAGDWGFIYNNPGTWTVATPPPATLISPSGTIYAATPAFTWNAVSNASWYYLWVDDASTSPRITQWYTAAQAGCASGTGTCSVTPATALAPGQAQWWIQTWNEAGYGPWSSGMVFYVPPLGAATLVSPAGATYDFTPTYTWNAVPGSTWYYLWVNDSTGTKIQTWYTAAAAGCGSGTGTCSVTPSTGLMWGAFQWWIQTYGAFGYGPWSSGLSFTVSIPTLPSRPTPVSPMWTITGPTPTYTWNAVFNATWYYLWVDDSSGHRIDTWYTSAEAGCASGTGTCSVTPATVLAAGPAQWWVQGWNSEMGYGPWSYGVFFFVESPPPVPVLISPSGTIATTTPTYTWYALPRATWYYLWVDDCSGHRIDTWYTSAEAGCASGTGTCSVTPATVLAAGTAQWWVQAWNPAGYGPWSDGTTFNILSLLPPYAPVPVLGGKDIP